MSKKNKKEKANKGKKGNSPRRRAKVPPITVDGKKKDMDYVSDWS
jgi:hypothetical protein